MNVLSAVGPGRWCALAFTTTLLYLLLLGPGCLPAHGQNPRCDDCQRVQDTVAECHHWADDPDGTPCSTTTCILNVLDTSSCQFHPKEVGAPDCDTDDDKGGAVIQTIRQSDCPGGTVHWTDWRTTYSGCDTDCTPFTWRVACVTGSCTGTIIRGPFNRGQKKKCGCD